MRKVRSRLRRGLSSVLSRISMRVLLKLGAVIVVLGGAGVGLCCIQRQVGSFPTSQINVENIVVTNVPACIRCPLIQEDIRYRLIPEKANILDPDLIPDMIRRYDTAGSEMRKKLHWLREILHVRKKYPNSLEMRLSLRVPAAYVRHGSETYVTDSQGVRLPNNYYKRPTNKPDLLCIIGLKGRPPDEGEKWLDLEALLSGLSTVRDIEEHGSRFEAGITTVDVSNFGFRQRRESPVVLWTHTHTRILWGRSTRHRIDRIDLSAEQKLENLNSELAKKPDLSKTDYIQVFSTEPSTMPRGGRT